MTRKIKQVNLPLTKNRKSIINWAEEWFNNSTQKQKELFFIYQDNLENKILRENGEWATDWELQLWWLVHKQHHPKTKDWTPPRGYQGTLIIWLLLANNKKLD